MFFWLSKLVWLIISPDMVLVFLAAAGLICLFTRRVKMARVLFACLVFLMAAIAVLPLGQWMYAPLENRFAVHPDLPEKIEGIIMLGGSENAHKSRLWEQPEINGAAERYLGFIKLARQFPDARLFFTGGSGNPVRPHDKDAHVARQVLEILGLDKSPIVFEQDSRNTWENGKFTRALANPVPGQNWVLVTSAAHMPRAFGVFERLGWPVIAFPVDHYTFKGKTLSLGLNFSGNLYLAAKAAREWTGLVAYYATGKIPCLLPPAR